MNDKFKSTNNIDMIFLDEVSMISVGQLEQIKHRYPKATIICLGDTYQI